jgi:phosphatidylglycerophosphate synthase
MRLPRRSEPRPRGRWKVCAVNAITLGRLLLGLAFPWIPPDARLAAVGAAGLSDAIDGILSRMLDARSDAGQILDPIADKAFILGVLATLVVEGRLTWPELLLLAPRDVCVLAGTIVVAATRGVAGVGRLPPSWPGKATTLGQFLYLLTVVAGVGVERRWPLLLPTTALSLWAGVGYLRRGVVDGSATDPA